MDNIIATLPARVSPEAVNAGAPEGLKTGHLSYADDLYKAFTADVFDNTKISVLRLMAVEKGLTCEEFKEQCKAAQAKATQTDALAGFKAPEGAKGIEQYGPTRRVLNQRLSEAKQIFGVFKMSPDILKEKGYVASLESARMFLAEQGKKWDGTRAPTEAEKQTARDSERAMKALKTAMQEYPQEAGESFADWNLRLSDVVDAELEALKESEQLEAIHKAYNKAVKTFGVDMLEAIFQYTLEGMETDALESLQHWVQEELVIRHLEETL